MEINLQLVASEAGDVLALKIQLLATPHTTSRLTFRQPSSERSGIVCNMKQRNNKDGMFSDKRNVQSIDSCFS